MSFCTNFLDDEAAIALAKEHGTPSFFYSKEVLTNQANTILGLPAPYGLTIRYAMKANPHIEILELFRDLGLSIDASSSYEAYRAIEVGFVPESILLTSQQLPDSLAKMIEQGVKFNATSLHQLEEYGKIAPNTDVTIRINPGIGSGHSAKTDVGGATSSFGIWHEYIPKIHEIAHRYDLKITRLHTQIGSGADPAIWQEAAGITLDLVKEFPDVTTLNLGGGFKVARMDDETGVDMSKVGAHLKLILEKFANSSGRKLHLELEPGTFLVANAGILLSTIHDIVDTGKDGFKFLKLDTGMNDILRPIMYGAKHPMGIITQNKGQGNYVVVGHNCESADLLTPGEQEGEVVSSILLNKASIGDLMLIGGAGAYCASMAAHNYNSFPSAHEILV